MRSLAVIVLVAVAIAPGIDNEEVVERHPDGTVKAQYHVDEQRRKQGAFNQWFPNGKLAVRTWYRDDELDGDYADYFEDGSTRATTRYKRGRRNGEYSERAADGKPFLQARYVDGELDGERTIAHDGKVVSRQVWKAGALITLDGHPAFGSSLDAIRAGLAAILAAPPPPIPPPEPKGPTGPGGKTPREKRGKKERPEPKDPSGPYKPSEPASAADPKLEAARLAAFKRLQQVRFLAGVPFDDMVLDPRLDELCQAGARLLAAIGHLDHTPANPGLPDDEYRAGFAGTSNSNISTDDDLARAVDDYMDDSDESNIGRVGHRRHAIDPGLQRVGFGAVPGFSTMWALDRSRARPDDLPFVAWPAAGWMPLEFFAPHEAWSVTFAPGRQPSPDEEVHVRVFALDDLYVPTGPPLTLDHQVVAGDTVIFRPQLERLAAGSRFGVEIAGVPTKKDVTSYLVEFASLAKDPARPRQE